MAMPTRDWAFYVDERRSFEPKENDGCIDLKLREDSSVRKDCGLRRQPLSPQVSVLSYFTRVKVRRQRELAKKSIGLANGCVSSYDQ